MQYYKWIPLVYKTTNDKELGTHMIFNVLVNQLSLCDTNDLKLS